MPKCRFHHETVHVINLWSNSWQMIFFSKCYILNYCMPQHSNAFIAKASSVHIEAKSMCTYVRFYCSKTRPKKTRKINRNKIKTCEVLENRFYSVFDRMLDLHTNIFIVFLILYVCYFMWLYILYVDRHMIIKNYPWWEKALGPWLPMTCHTKALIRLQRCEGWSEWSFAGRTCTIVGNTRLNYFIIIIFIPANNKNVVKCTYPG